MRLADLARDTRRLAGRSRRSIASARSRVRPDGSAGDSPAPAQQSGIVSTVRRADVRPVVPRQRRRAFLEARVAVSDLAVLEMGAFDQPSYTPDEIDIHFFDRFSPAELSDKYGHVTTRTTSAAVEPDIVSKDKRFAAEIAAHRPDGFDLVIAHHVLEHVADPLTWLAQLASVTRPGGHLFMALPDRRFTFDILRRETTVTDWLRWRAADLEKPSAEQLFDAIYYHRPVRHMDVWNDEMTGKLESQRFPADDAWRRAMRHAEESAPDTHCSVFTWESFQSLWREIEELDQSWRWSDGAGVEPGSNEFTVLLSRSADDEARPSSGPLS